MTKQSTSLVNMVRPATFYYDEATAESNSFQEKTTDSKAETLRKVHAEFDSAVALIRSKGVEVLVVEDTVPGDKPNAIFPNNWYSTHQDGTMVLYSMNSISRREERKIPVIEAFQEKGLQIEEIIDMSFYEDEGRFLEGTGSLILDRINRLAFAGLSDRTDAELVRTFGNELGFETFAFETADLDGKPIYHTNVMMSIGTGFSVVCLDAVKGDAARSELRDRLEQWGLQVVEISFDQMGAFAGNVIEVEAGNGKRYLLLSSSAFASLKDEQKQILESYIEFLPVEIPTIQKIGGGGIRCMVAEVFLEK